MLFVRCRAERVACLGTLRSYPDVLRKVLQCDGGSMTRKMSNAEAKRSPLNLRTTSELRARLDAVAAQNGRSITQEVERRLEQSFEDNPHRKLGDPIPGVFSDEMRTILRGHHAFAQLIEAVAETCAETIKAANRKNRDEIEVRTAMRAALNVVADRFLWRGEETETPVEPPLAPLGTRKLDYPPAHLGYEVADQRVLWLSDWHEDDAALDTAEGRIRNLYSGDGRTVLIGPSAEDEEARRERERVDAKAALARGDVEYEAPERVHLYKPVRSDPPVAEDGDAPPPRSLKDIMGR